MQEAEEISTTEDETSAKNRADITPDTDLIEEYKIISSMSKVSQVSDRNNILFEVQENVEKFIKLGWVPQGGLSTCAAGSDSDYICAAQAMVLTREGRLRGERYLADKKAREEEARIERQRAEELAAKDALKTHFSKFSSEHPVQGLFQAHNEQTVTVGIPRTYNQYREIFNTVLSFPKLEPCLDVLAKSSDEWGELLANRGVIDNAWSSNRQFDKIVKGIKRG